MRNLSGLMLRQAQHEDDILILTLSLSKGEERFAKRTTWSCGPVRVMNAACLGEQWGRTHDFS